MAEVQIVSVEQSASRAGRFSYRRPALSRLLWVLALLPAGLVLLPVLYLLLRTFESGISGASLFLNLGTLQTLLRTAALSASVTFAAVVVAVPIAWLTVRTDLPGRKVWSVLAALPMVIPSYIAAYLMVAFLGPRGMFAQWLGQWAGIERLPSIYGFPGAFFILTLLCYPYILLGARAALQGMDPALEEAARSLGYSPLQVFLRVTLPQLRPAVAAGGLLAALYVLRDFGAVSIMRYDTFTRVVYVQYKSAFDRASASGLALILVALTLLLLAVESRTRTRARYHRSASGAARQPAVARLGKWRWPALIFTGAVVTFGLILPLGVLLFWLVRGVQAGEQLAPVWAAAQNSILASVLAAVFTMAAAFPIAFLSARNSSRLSSLLERVTYSGYALPGIVVALAMVFISINYAFHLYQSLVLLIVAYMILFLPQAVGSVQASLLQVNGNLEESARSLGASPLAALRKITLPLVKPGLLAGMAMVFLTAMKELPATLILSPLGFKTLATGVWSAVSEAFFAQAAAPALLLIIFSAIPMAFLTFTEH